MKKLFFFLAPLLFLMSYSSLSQCTNASKFGTITAPKVPGAVTITTCAFGGENNTINTCSISSIYQIAATGGTGNFITVRQTKPGSAKIIKEFKIISN